ncbi:DNA mismatch repair protein MutL [Salinigranum rubrum]|uniref:DNA mismatch repair protein MutL n=1 Tax=Salinigranum rubrum TaxID=755307 RepID=A0A2I8VFH4_9EURY|nr:DNA mismatch repair endonuclease MutL [Salinigranum rubrum]AUV80683.1 DNA mismatch repair protein MutL [Salinigranum rubrum]
MSDGGDAGGDEQAPDHDIRALDAGTVQRIAAGEVVERPASVVKELVENSLDADASRVSVAVEGDGTRELRVRDDGVGMTESALRTAVEEHTTSKIRDIDDLEAGVGTLGFRGEALHTIGAVSRMTIRSKPRGGARGTELVYEGGAVESVSPAGCPEGTVVEVRDLFFNTPARRKFLKTEATEFDHINTVVTQYALANPDVAVSLEHDDREVFATEGRGSREAAVLSVYGREVAESMTRVDGGTDGVSVEGLVSDPETTRSTREYLSTFVNGRYVTSPVLREAVLDAYGGQLAPDRYPFAVLFVEVPPETVDVNVHPRKMEVRFDDEQGVRRAVREGVESALIESGLIRSAAPRGRSKAAETEIRPEPPDSEAVGEPERRGGRTDGRRPERASRADSRPASTGTEREESTSEGTSSTADEEESTSSTATDATPPEPEAEAAGADGEREVEPADDGGDADEQSGTGAWHRREPVTDPHAPDDAEETADATDEREQTALSASAHSAGTPAGDARDAADGVDSDRDSDSDDEATAQAASPSADAQAGPVVGPATQRTLAGSAVDLDRTFDRLPRLRVLGQLHETYIVAASEEGLVLVDQHAADERVNYERLKAELEGETPTQALATPVELELTAREAALFDRYQEALARVGFHAGRVDERVVEVRTVPAVFDATLDPDRLRDALTGFVTDEDGGGRETVDAAAEELIADLACYPSVTGNTSLTEGSVVDLLEALDACDNPYACPHGRPTIIRVDRDEIEDRFERDYPGHAGRRREE